MSVLRRTIRTRDTEAKTVRKQYVLFARVFRLGAKELSRGSSRSISSKRRDWLLNLDWPHNSQRLRARSLGKKNVVSASLGVVCKEGVHTERFPIGSSLRSQEMRQCRALAHVYCERKHTRANLQQHGAQKRRQNLLSEVWWAVLNQTERSSLLQALPPRGGHGLPARTPRQAEARSQAAKGDFEWQQI